MAHKKAGGSTANIKDSQAQRLGVKAFGGEKVKIGAIIIRQRGTHFVAGPNVFMGKDHTLHAKVAGKVNFAKFKHVGFDSRKQTRVRVGVNPLVKSD